MQVCIDLPKVIEVRDYHDFRFIQDTLRSLGLTDIQVEEVGFDPPLYIGVVHAATEEHCRFVKDMAEKYVDGA